MPRISSRRSARWAALTAATIVVLPGLALAWSQSASFETHVHGHAFSRVNLESKGCEIRLLLPFEAPEAGYKHEAAARNIYRFHARIKLDKGHAFETPIFQNSVPGARSYGYTKDTALEGCWAKEEHQLRAVDIEGCRGGGCKPDPFE